MDLNADIAILTVLPEEYRAVYQRLSNPRRADSSPELPNIYAWTMGEISHADTNNSYSVVLGMTGQAGTSHGALATIEAISRWKPRYVFFVGIAGGLEYQDLNKGDVVIADLIIGYEYGKLEPDFVPRDDWIFQVDKGLLRTAIAFATINTDWQMSIAIDPPEKTFIPSVIKGQIASGDKVVDDPTGQFFRSISDSRRRIQAVEMEGAGAAEAIEQARALGANVGFLMIRGISDIPRATPGIVGRGTQERDAWKKYAADVAATFAVSYISTALPVPPEVIGGRRTSLTIAGVTSSASMTMLTSQIDYLSEQISGEVGLRLDEMRSAWRKGRKEQASDWISTIKTDETSWRILSPDVKAKLLRFEASLKLDTKGDVVKAKALAEEAIVLCPSEGDIKLNALIAYRESGAEAALLLLTGEEDPDTLNFKAALHLETGQIAEARDVLWSEPLKEVISAETYRLRSLWYLSVKETDHSLLEIHKALELEPRWESIRYTAAVMHYFSALSPAALPERLVPWPEPVDWSLVKKDSESLSHIRKADELIRELLDSPEIEVMHQHKLRAWLLACLANDPDQQDEAIKLCESILMSDPTDVMAVIWAVTRRMGIDLDPSKNELETLVSDGDPTIPHIIALEGYYLSHNLNDEAVNLLEHTRSIFEQNRAEDLWTFWWVQSLAVCGKYQEALDIIDESELENELRDARSTALRSLAVKSDDWQPLIDHLEESYEETGNPSYLFECCALKAQVQEWDYIAERAELLVKEIGTSEALYLAAIGSYNSNRLELCLELLNDHQRLFTKGRLPGALQRIQILIRESLGLLPEALNDAEALANEEPTEENLLTLAQIYFRMGDLKKISIVARRLESFPALNSENALGIARLIQSEDQNLARSLWRKAISQDLPESLVGEAVALGYQLGLDEEVRALHSRFEELGLAGRGGIELWSIEQFIKLGEQFQEQRSKLNEAYAEAAIPIHFVSELVNRPLVDFYHRILEENERVLDQPRPFALLGRHGGRSAPVKFPERVPEWRLNLDVTAFLLAAHFDLLSSVEEVFRPIRIPPDLMHALIHMRQQLFSHQPSRLEIYQEIIDLEVQGKLQTVDCKLADSYENTALIDEMGNVWVALFENAHANDGYFVDFFPVTKRDLRGPPTALPENANKLLVNTRAIIEALRSGGPLTEQEYLESLERLGIEGLKESSETIPSQGSHLYFRANTPEVLAEAKLLPLICDRFRVHIEVEELRQAKATIRMYESAHDVASWLDGLMERLRNGIEEGTYQIIPSPIDIPEASKELPPKNPETSCLVTLLRFEANESDVIWSDDRYMNSYMRRDKVPIISILEVLSALVSAGALDLNEYYKKLQRLREANVLFIPLHKDEILYHLQHASFDGGRIIESQALSTIRRYACASLLRGDILQRPPMPENAPNKYGEVAYVIELGRAITNALIESWAASNREEESSRARAEWIISNLYLDHLALLRVTSMLREEQDPRYLVSLSLAGLLAQAITLDPRIKNDSLSPRRRYLDWIYNRIICKRIDADRPILLTVIDILKQLILSENKTDPEDVPEAVVLAMIQGLHRDLPKEIRDQISNDIEFMEKIGLKYQSIVAVEDVIFNPDEFLQAVAHAVNGRQGTIAPTGSDTEVTFSSITDDKKEAGFYFNHPETGKRYHIEDDLFELLRDSVSERDEFIRGKRIWFEVADELFEREVSRITTIEDLGRRLEEARRWKESSTQIFYENLYKRFIRCQELQFDNLLPPSAKGLLWAFRLETDFQEDHKFQDILNGAAKILMGEEGLAKAIMRFASLPTHLPECLVALVLVLPPPEKRRLIKQLIGVVGTPLSKLHLLHLLLILGDKGGTYHRLAKRILVTFIDDEGKVAFEAFRAILNWTNIEFGHWPEAQECPIQLRLVIVWAHAVELYRILISSGAPAIWLRDTFDRPSFRISSDLFDRDSIYWQDIAQPRRIDYETFFVTGLCYSYSGKAEALIDQQARDVLMSLAFQGIDGILYPRLPLLRDPARNLNCLDSFMATDLGDRLNSLFDIHEADQITHESLHRHAKASLDRISEVSDEIPAWLQLHAVVGDIPIYNDLRAQFGTLLRKTDYALLMEKDAKLGIIPMILASRQSINFGDEELTRHLREELPKIAKYLAERDATDQPPHYISEEDSNDEIVDMRHFLIEATASIALSVKPAQDSITEFGELLIKLVDAWPSMKQECKYILQRIYEEFPVEQAKELLPMLVRLRSE